MGHAAWKGGCHSRQDCVRTEAKRGENEPVPGRGHGGAVGWRSVLLVVQHRAAAGPRAFVQIRERHAHGCKPVSAGLPRGMD